MIYLIRHGQTEFNLVHRHHGWTDSPLTPLGREQARRAGAALAGLIVPVATVVFSSPLGRALDTARIILDVADIAAPLTTDANLMEIGMGSCEGLTEAEMRLRYPELGEPSPPATMSLQSPDGESLEALAARLDRAPHRVLADPSGTRIIVSHGVAIRMLQALYLGRTVADVATFDAPQDAMFQLDHGSVSRIRFHSHQRSSYRPASC